MNANAALTPEEIELQELAERAYDKVLQHANRFMHTCKTFPMEILKLEDPSYSEIARHLTQAAEFIGLVLNRFDAMVGTKAKEYCEVMTKMGVAIQDGDEQELARLVKQLERKPGL